MSLIKRKNFIEIRKLKRYNRFRNIRGRNKRYMKIKIMNIINKLDLLMKYRLNMNDRMFMWNRC